MAVEAAILRAAVSGVTIPSAWVDRSTALRFAIARRDMPSVRPSAASSSPPLNCALIPAGVVQTFPFTGLVGVVQWGTFRPDRGALGA